MHAGTQQPPSEWPKPGSLVGPYLWSLGLVVGWGVSFVALMVLSLVLRFNSASDAGYDNAQDVGLAVSMVIEAIGGLAVLATFIALAWVKGRRSPAARLRFLGYGTLALGGLWVIALLALIFLPNGSPA